MKCKESPAVLVVVRREGNGKPSGLLLDRLSTDVKSAVGRVVGMGCSAIDRARLSDKFSTISRRALQVTSIDPRRRSLKSDLSIADGVSPS
jgi:hypothetical protein